MRALSPLQVLNRSTSAMHAAALFRPGEGIIAVREDDGVILVSGSVPGHKGAYLTIRSAKKK
jgi:hypothetical protein